MSRRLLHMFGVLLLSGTVICLSRDVWAETAEEKGLAIALESDGRAQGWSDSSVTLQMILTNRHGCRE